LGSLTASVFRGTDRKVNLLEKLKKMKTGESENLKRILSRGGNAPKGVLGEKCKNDGRGLKRMSVRKGGGKSNCFDGKGIRLC